MTDRTPLISVIIPACNAAETISEALQSVADQTVQPYEVIVIDDGSTDGTVEAAGRQFQLSALNCHLLSLPANRGPAAARNRGIEIARGEWLAFLDADDVWLTRRLESQIELMGKYPDAVMFCGGTLSFDESRAGISKIESESTRDVNLEDFVDGNSVGTSTVMVRAGIVRQAGMFDERFRGPEDLDLWIRVAAVGRIVVDRRVVALYRERAGSLSGQPERFLPEVFHVYHKAFGEGGALYPFRHLRRRSFAARYTSAAWTYLARGRRSKALATLIHGWLIWPFRMGIEKRRPLWRINLLGRIILGRRMGEGK